MRNQATDAGEIGALFSCNVETGHDAFAVVDDIQAKGNGRGVVLVLVGDCTVGRLVHGRQERGVFGCLGLLGFSAAGFLLVDEALFDNSIQVASNRVCTIQGNQYSLDAPRRKMKTYNSVRAGAVALPPIRQSS